jgi:hypothetical protein
VDQDRLLVVTAEAADPMLLLAVPGVEAEGMLSSRHTDCLAQAA